MRAYRLAVCAALLLTAPAYADEGEMLLVCRTSAAASVTTSTTTGSAFDNRGNSAFGRSNTSEPGVVEIEVQLRIRGAIAEMNVPGAATELSSGKAGWYPVKRLQVSDDEITGRVQYNFLSSSSFRIDRRTGAISSSGGFAGTCLKADLTKRAF